MKTVLALFNVYRL